METSTILIIIILIAGLLVFPFTVSLYLARSKALGTRKFLKFLRCSKNLAVSFVNVLIAEYKAIAFIPNAIGSLAALTFYFSEALNVDQGLVIQLFLLHLTLIVVSSVGIGILQIATSNLRAFLAFIGESVSSWAFISGNLFLVYFLLLLWTPGLSVFLLALVSIILFFMGLVLAYSLKDSVETYVEGAKKWVQES